MPELFPHQMTGACFLAERKHALLADEQRVGKTAAAIRACDYVFARTVLVITTASAREQWRREFQTWGWSRRIQVIHKQKDVLAPETDVAIVSWKMFRHYMPKLVARRWDVLLIDESHYAKNPGAVRTWTMYGTEPGRGGLCDAADHIWCLTGTPVPNSPADLYPMLNRLAPERVEGLTYDDFVKRYCVVKLKRFNGVMQRVIKGGKNEDELKERAAWFWLRRTQKDVGIRPPIFSTFPLSIDKKLPKELQEDVDAQAVLDALETGETKSLEMHLGPVARITGMLKAKAVVEAVTELLEDGQLDKIVLMAWHTDVIDALYDGLQRFGTTGIDGRTSPSTRDTAQISFTHNPGIRVFIGQIQAAGEAIDLSAAAELWFVESSFQPKDMAQAALRITNHSQKRQALVRVCALAGSIDEAFQTILTRKVASIRTLMEN